MTTATTTTTTDDWRSGGGFFFRFFSKNGTDFGSEIGDPRAAPQDMGTNTVPVFGPGFGSGIGDLGIADLSAVCGGLRV